MNCTSHPFAQLLKQMSINIINQQPSSQGALEHFHQTLKPVWMLLAESWLLLAAREVVHGSTGFTPKELVSGQKAHGAVWVEIVQGRQTGKAEAGDSTGKSEKGLLAGLRFISLVQETLCLVTSPFQAKPCGPSLRYSNSQI